MKLTVLGPAVVLIAVAVNHADDTKDSGLIRGKLKSADLDRGILTVALGEQDREFRMNENTRFLDKDGEATALNIKTQTLPKLFMEWTLSPNTPPFTITYMIKDGKEIALSVRLPIMLEARRKQNERAFQDSLLGKSLPDLQDGGYASQDRHECRFRWQGCPD